MTAQIAVSAAIYAIDKPYSYLIPNGMQVAAGVRVLVPFGRGNRACEGIVLALSEDTAQDCKPILQVLDETPVLSESMLRLAAFLRERYFCTFFDAIRAMLPAGMWFSVKDTYTISELPEDWQSLCKRKPCAQSVMQTILDLGENAKHELLAQQFAPEELEDALRYLLNKKWLTAQTDYLRKVSDKTEKIVSLAVSAEEAEAFISAKRRSAAVQAQALKMLVDFGTVSAKELCYFTGATSATIKRLEEYGLVETTSREVLRLHRTLTEQTAQRLTLNQEQQAVFEALDAQSSSEKPGIALLYGVTGSGKTAVYLELISQTLRRGKQAIMLVPEIALTPQLLALFAAHFGKQVAVLHSSLQVSERYDEFKRIARGEATVVLGTRSAVFAPVRELGLLIVDEEQEHTYKSENNPRYHAREAAIFRGAQEKALVLLGSATPSVETMYHAKCGDYQLYTLRNRFNRSALPPVEVVDMKEQIRCGNSGVISSVLLDSIRENLKLGQQTILFLNRRGSSRLTVCIDCGYVPECPRCSVNLTYHQANGRLMCHHCGFSQLLTDRCEKCGGHYKQVGFGTQRVEEELKSLLPETEVLRMDADTVSATNPHEKILETFREKNVPILLGTQMVTKGLNFENVTLVGVLNADAALYNSSYRAQETTFSLITQVVGRAGRGAKLGRAVIQTMTPENPVIVRASCQDYDAFFETEIMMRRVRSCPPFSDLVTVSFSGAFEAEVQRGAQRFRQMLASACDKPELAMQVLGPAPAPIMKLNNRFRYQLTVQCKLTRPVRQMLAYLLREFAKNKINRGVTVFADLNAY
ncbi:MAG: primosomal protein N' [Clostridia bacterium]|nr:primosomal protein N' [Clostridia bacterium]